MKINTVARTKLGVYSCPSLRIAENQELGKDKIRIFCPRLLKANFFFSFFLFLIFFDFPFSDFFYSLDFSFSIFLDFFFFSIFWIFFFYDFFGFFFFCFFFVFFHLDLLYIASQTHSHLFIWTYSLSDRKSVV